MLAEMLYGLFDKTWEQEEIPSQWKEGLLIKIPKKRDLGLCSNYKRNHTPVCPRESTEQSHLGKVEGPVDRTIRDQQAGFRAVRPCTDQITTLQIIVEQSIEWNSRLYVNLLTTRRLLKA